MFDAVSLYVSVAEDNKYQAVLIGSVPVNDRNNSRASAKSMKGSISFYGELHALVTVS